MDGQDYLNQIANSVRPPAKKSKFGGIFSSPITKVILIGLLVLIIIIIIGSVINGGRGNTKDKSISLKLHIDNTTSLISEYQPSVKSTILRSSSASLSTILSNTSRELTSYLVDKYKYTDKTPSDSLKESATLSYDALNQDLFEAKINGILDRIYAHKMAYEINLITSEEATIYNSTSDDTLKSLIESSYNSLNNLYPQFNDFSETK